MNVEDIGLPSFHTRVERWECDYNNHWNTSFFCRSFQMAAETVAGHSAPDLSGRTNSSRHIRFYRELFASEPVEIRSAILRGAGHWDGATVHLLLSGTELCATALDLPGGAENLPEVGPGGVPFAMPRGIGVGPSREWTGTDMTGTIVRLGTVRPYDVDHSGTLLFEKLSMYASVAANACTNLLGFTREYIEETRVGRMVVEFRLSRFCNPPVGSILLGQSHLSAAKGKNFWLDHRILTAEGEHVATLEMCLVTVDLRTRRAVPVPQFLHDALTA